MILDRLVVENFRPYEGRSEIEFAPPGLSNVTVIRGRNGAGKSSLFMALKWCFGGVAPVEQRYLACTSALARAATGATVETRAEATYSHEGRRFKAVRSFRTRVGEPQPNGEPSFAPEPTAKFELYEISAHGDAKPVTAPYDEIKSAAPREAMDYFFFDGEQIETFAKDNNGGAIRKAVWDVLRFAELENAIRHVDAARLEYSSKQKRAAGSDTAALIQQREDLAARIDELRSDLERLDTDAAQAKHVRDEYLARLKELASVRALAEERVGLDHRRDDLSNLRDAAIEELAGGFPSLSTVLADSALQRAKGLVDTKRRRGEIPSKVKAQVLRDWLERGECICGRPLTHGSSEHDAIRVELEKSIPSRLEEELVSMGGAIDAARRDGAKQVERSRLTLTRLNQAREMAIAVNDRLRQIDIELGSQPIEDVAKIAAKIRETERNIEDWTTRRAEAASEASRAQSTFDRLTVDIAKSESHNRQATRLGRRHDLAARTVSALRELKETFEGDVRSEVEKEASRLFEELIWKSGAYSAVTLSSDFRLEALDRWGMPAFSVGGTSMGESRVLSIAFIVAMQEVARTSLDTQSPAVIDSPFGNLSIVPMTRICEQLPLLVDQVVLFVTDSDWQLCGVVLQPRTNHLYEIDFDEEAVASVRKVQA